MAAKTGQYDIPFDDKGNQLDYPGWGLSNWKPNFEFEDTLKLEGFGRGRSSVTFRMRRTDGTTVSVFVSDFYDMALAGAFKAGTITGRFTFVKKGANYGCKLIGGGE